MSRKEVMIAAVLVNAGLLIVLFASALKTDESQSVPLVQESKVLEKAPGPIDLSAATLASVPVKEEPVVETPPVESFVNDVKAVSKPETALVKAPESPSVQTLVAPIAKKSELAGNVVEVKVKKGDVLEKIARHNNSTVADIMKANQLTNSNLRIGQVLKVPTKEPSALMPKTAAPEGKWYEVKKGDSPWTIAVQHHIKVEELLKLNQMSEVQAKKLKPGDKIRIQ